jgi:hypothetical protein
MASDQDGNPSYKMFDHKFQKKTQCRWPNTRELAERESCTRNKSSPKFSAKGITITGIRAV